MALDRGHAHIVALLKTAAARMPPEGLLDTTSEDEYSDSGRGSGDDGEADFAPPVLTPPLRTDPSPFVSAAAAAAPSSPVQGRARSLSGQDDLHSCAN